MRIRVSAPGSDLSDSDMDRIRRDLEKIDRRLSDWGEVDAQVRVNHDGSAQLLNVVLEVNYGRHHLLAKAQGSEIGQTVREAREEILRQINDRSRGGHSSFAKGR